MTNEQLTEASAATETAEKKPGKKPVWVLILTLVLAVGVGTGIYLIWHNTGYLTTDNARVTTRLIAITPSVPGRLERFTVYEGRYVAENEILGWVENGETMRSPIAGLVISSNARQDQMVSPLEPIAIIADTNNIHIQANIAETDIAGLYIGQRAYITIDTFGNRQFSGYIYEIGRITNAELAGTAMFFNTGGNFTRVTHLIPIEIVIVDDIDLDNLIGVNARVRIPLR